MTFTSGTRIGPYEVVARLGAGGMGEVWRGKDTRLGRAVAIKVLPAAMRDDPERLRRFEQEARATGALSHANLIAVFDVGEHAGAPYLVTELLEGQTLRERLAGGAVPSRRALGWAAQIARGLAAAHAKGVIHRDLKPDNLFVTEDDQVKILDFGIAKLTTVGVDAGADLAHLATMAAVHTSTGAIVGTPAYMAPEQLTGGTVDARSDVFALGLVLYEMLAGRRPFEGESAVELSYAILKHEARPLPASLVTPAVERLVVRCLDKRPDRRFQSASDLAFALEALAGSDTTTGSSPPTIPVSPTRGRSPRAAIAVAAVVGALGAGVVVFVTTRPADSKSVDPMAAPAPPEPPMFTGVTPQPRPLQRAQFSADGRSAYYSVQDPGRASQLVVSDLRTGVTRTLPMTGRLAAVSAVDELALLLGGGRLAGRPTSLHRQRLDGSAAQPVLDDVIDAAWDPAGELAVIHRVGTEWTIEHPIGQVRYRHPHAVFDNLVVAPDGVQLAFLERPDDRDTAGNVVVVDHDGKARVVAGPLDDVTGVAWSPDGREVWYSADLGDDYAIVAVALDGARRVLARIPGVPELHDVAADGRVLVTRSDGRILLQIQGRDPASARDLGWHGGALITSLTADGSRLSFHEGLGVGQTEEGYATLIRGVDGAPPQPMGNSFASALTADGAQLISLVGGEPDTLVAAPTGPGASRTLPRGTIADYARGTRISISLDGTTIAYQASDATGSRRVFVQRLDGGEPRALEARMISGSQSHPLSPDGAWLAVLDESRLIGLYPTRGGDRRPVPGAALGERPLGFSRDGAALYVLRAPVFPLTVERLVLTTGKRTPWAIVQRPAPEVGDENFYEIEISADGETLGTSTFLERDELYLVSGLPRVR